MPAPPEASEAARGDAVAGASCGCPLNDLARHEGGDGPVAETRETRLRRLAMRSARRGTREMDLILGGFAAASLDRLPPGMLDAFEAVLSENDQDLYHWISGQSKAPAAREEIVGRIRAYLERD